MPYAKNNPHFQEEHYRYHAFFRTAEDRYEDIDGTYEHDIAKTAIRCGICGKDTAWFKASVGTHICTECGGMWVSGRQMWIDRSN